MWKETRAPGGNPHQHETTQTPHRKGLQSVQHLNLGPSSCEARAITHCVTVPPVSNVKIQTSEIVITGVVLKNGNHEEMRDKQMTDSVYKESSQSALWVMKETVKPSKNGYTNMSMSKRKSNPPLPKIPKEAFHYKINV